MRRKIALAVSLLLIPLLTGCSSSPSGGGGIDILKFLQNPVVMVVLGVIIAFWMFKRK